MIRRFTRIKWPQKGTKSAKIAEMIKLATPEEWTSYSTGQADSHGQEILTKRKGAKNKMKKPNIIHLGGEKTIKRMFWVLSFGFWATYKGFGFWVLG